MTKMILSDPLQWLIFYLFLLFIPGFPTPGAFGADPDPSSIGISVNAENEALTKVLEKISQISGYEIEFDQEWGNHPVNIRFENESLEDALNRVLANLNHALVWNDAEKKISIFINGEVSDRGSTSSPSVSRSSPVSRGSNSRMQENAAAGSSDRAPSRGSNKIGDMSPTTSGRKSRERAPRSEGDLPVSVSGQKTRFRQGTSTID